MSSARTSPVHRCPRTPPSPTPPIVAATSSPCHPCLNKGEQQQKLTPVGRTFLSVPAADGQECPSYGETSACRRLKALLAKSGRDLFRRIPQADGDVLAHAGPFAFGLCHGDQPPLGRAQPLIDVVFQRGLQQGCP